MARKFTEIYESMTVNEDVRTMTEGMLLEETSFESEADYAEYLRLLNKMGAGDNSEIIAAIRKIVARMPDRGTAEKIEKRLRGIEAKVIEPGISYMNIKNPKQI